MLCLTKDELAPYLKSFCPGIAGMVEEDSDVSRESFDSTIELDDQCGRYYYLAGLIADWMAPFSAAAVLVTEFGIFPSRENLHLVQKVRAAYSENRPLFLAPGHLLTGFEVPDLRTLLHLCFLCSWGGIASTNESKAMYFSHDGWVGFQGANSLSIGRDWAAT